jgi:8-oxo-dGTP pyrophosphatase MutT (NUDIX family)
MKQWHPHKTVATVIEKNGLFLMVEEMIAGKLLYNQPAGHLEPGETLMAGAIRETLEETAWEVQLTGFLGLYQYTTKSDNICYIRSCFIAEPSQHYPNRALDAGVLRALWMSKQDLEARRHQLRSQIVLRVIEDYLTGKRYPLDTVVAIN